MPDQMELNLDVPWEMRTIDAAELGKLIGRSTKSVKVDAYRRPLTLPPRFKLPGAKRHQFLWRLKEVMEWMDALAQLEAERRKREVEFARRFGVKDVAPRPFHLGHNKLGAKARARQDESLLTKEPGDAD